MIFSSLNSAFTDTFFAQHDCYDISIFPVNELPKGNTSNFVETLKQIIFHFFEDKSRLLFFQCLTDGKEASRSRKFSFWYSMAHVDDLIKKIDTVISKGEHEFHQSMIYHTENINATYLETEFIKFIYEFREK